MSKLPIDQYLQNAARTEVEMKSSLEDIRDVIAEVGGGYTENLGADWIIETKDISASVTAQITVPQSQFIAVESEDTLTDTLTSIAVTGLPDGRVIYLSAAHRASTYDDSLTVSGTGRFIRMNHNSSGGSGTMRFAGGVDAYLAGDRVFVMVLRGTSTSAYWEEVGRFYGSDKLSYRSFLGLGDVSTSDIATGVAGSALDKILKVGVSNLAAGDLLSIAADGTLAAAAAGGGSSNVTDAGFFAYADFVNLRIVNDAGTGAVCIKAGKSVWVNNSLTHSGVFSVANNTDFTTVPVFVYQQLGTDQMSITTITTSSWLLSNPTQVAQQIYWLAIGSCAVS